MGEKGRRSGDYRLIRNVSRTLITKEHRFRGPEGGDGRPARRPESSQTPTVSGVRARYTVAYLAMIRRYDRKKAGHRLAIRSSD